MKSDISIVFILTCFIFISCKQKSQSGDGNVKVIIDVVIKNDDDLILYYKDGSNDWFVDDKAVWASVKGSSEIQQVTFNINLNTIPNDYRLDIGRNHFKEKQIIQIKKFVLKYYDKSLVIPEEKFNLYFKGNEYIIYNEVTKMYILDKSKNVLYDPFFETTMEFYPQLLKLTE